MKELLISFLICLVIGSIINGMQQPAPPAAPDSSISSPAAEPGVSVDGDPGTAEPGSAEPGAAQPSTSAGSDKAQETSDSDFEQDVLKASVPVLVDFSASWCGPCHQMSPIVDKLAKEYNGKAKVFKVDIDRNPELTSKYHVNALPTFMMFRDGRSVSSHSGAMPKEMLAGVIDRQLGTQ